LQVSNALKLNGLEHVSLLKKGKGARDCVHRFNNDDKVKVRQCDTNHQQSVEGFSGLAKRMSQESMPAHDARAVSFV
jgi:uncharacterized Ntn-hydrolase superfamily protein